MKVKPVNGKHSAKSGEMLHPIMDILRTTKHGLTTREIAGRIIAARGLPADDTALLTTMARRTATAMSRLKAKGVAQREKAEGLELIWRAAEN